MSAKTIQERIAEEELRLAQAIQADEQRRAAETAQQQQIARSQAELKRLRVQAGTERWQDAKVRNQGLLDGCVGATNTMLQHLNNVAAQMLASVPGVETELGRAVEQQHEFRKRALNDYITTLVDQVGARENDEAYRRFMTNPEATHGAENALMLAAPPQIVLNAWVAEMPLRSMERRVRAAIAYCITGDLVDSMPQGTDSVSGYRRTQEAATLFSSGPVAG